MNRYLIFLFFWISTSLSAQVIGPSNSSFFSIRQNGVSSIAANGDTVWTSPALSYNIGNSPDWMAPTGIDSIYNDIGRVFSLSVSQDTLVAGLGFTSQTSAGNQPAGYGYYISTDGGENWQFSDFLLDEFPPDKCNSRSNSYVEPETQEDLDPDCYSLFEYGGETYFRKLIIVAEQSPPYNVDFRNNVVFSTNWASGLLRSTDFGNNWERIVLPPFGEDFLTPDRNDYEWVDCIEVQNSVCVKSLNIYDSVDDDNLKGFSVHIDSKNRVWYGSAGGINVSENALTAPIDSISWNNTLNIGASDGLLGRWIIEIKEDTSTSKIWMTNWIADSNDRFGIVATSDGGQTFEQHLIGEKILGLGFKDGYIFAAGENGLFISPDGGSTWRKSPQVKSANTFLKESAEFQTVAETNDRVWIGTSDGIISTNDYGENWEITRVNFPLSGGNQYDDETKSVNTYAYPNPYSPAQHELVRIRFEVNNTGNVDIKIFDFGMNLVRDLGSYNANSSGVHEAIWDGIDGKGRNVANGVYFYLIEGNGDTIDGKILLVE